MRTIYFAGSISGGREALKDYKMITSALKEWGEVLPEAVSSADVGQSGEERSAKDVFEETRQQIADCDVFVLEATRPSFGVGFQTAQALDADKPVLALYRRRGPISAILIGAPIRYEAYSSENDLKETLKIFFKEEK